MRRKNVKKSPQQRTQKRLHQVESLEDRRLMTANVGLYNGLLSISGDASDDYVVVETERKQVTISNNRRGALRSRYARQGNFFTTTVIQKQRNSDGLFVESSRQSVPGLVRHITFYGREGNDYFRNNTNIRTTAYAGPGYDRIYGGTAADTLHGGSENDFLSGGAGNDQGHSVEQTDDEGYFIVGCFDCESNESNMWLIKTNREGNEQWSQILGGNSYEWGRFGQQTDDGGYIVTGLTTSLGSGSSDAWLIRLNSQGEEIWDKTFGGVNGDGSSFVQETNDGGYILIGYTTSFSNNGSDIWLIKTDSDGNTEPYDN